MKQLKKLSRCLGILLIANGFFTAHAFAQGDSKKDAAGSLEVTGKFRTRGFYDFKPYEAQPYFSPASIPLTKDKSKQQQAGFDIVSAELGITKELPCGEDILKLVIKSKLKTEGVKLKRLYVDYGKFRTGLAVSNFCDLSAMPATFVDAPGCTAYATTVQLGWQDQLGMGLSYSLAAEKSLPLDMYPESDKKSGNKNAKWVFVNNIPAVTAGIKYERGFGHVRLGGILRMLDCHNTVGKSAKTHYKPAWGTNLTSSIKIIPEQTTLKLCGVYGQGIGSYLVDLASAPKTEPKEVHFTNSGKTELGLIGTLGGYLGLEHCWVPKLRSTLVYGILDTHVYGKAKRLEKSAYKQGHYFSTNLTYHPTKNWNLGAEYLYGVRFTISGKCKDAHRIQAVVGFTL